MHNRAALGVEMARGSGIVSVHDATGLLGTDIKPDADHPLVHGVGGYFAHQSHHHAVRPAQSRLARQP